MATSLISFDQSSSWSFTGGAALSTNGIKHAPLQTIGDMTTYSSADGSFTDAFGLGQMDTDTSGNLYVADTTNNRVQRFTKNSSGVWVYDSKCSATNALGSSVAIPMVAIDRVRNQIHIASSGQNVTNTLVGVWDVSSWPTLTTGNRVRSYGTASGSNGAGNLRTPVCLTIIGDFSIICSSAGDYRVIKYNHTTNTLISEDTNSLWKARFAANSDGTKYYSGAQATDTEIGLWRMNTSTLAGISRLDTTTGGTVARRGSLTQAGVGGDASDIVYYNNRVYVRGFTDGRIQAWSTVDDSFSDEFMWSGGAGTNQSFGHSVGFKPSNIQMFKVGIALAGDSTKSDDFIYWSCNAQNTSSQQSFLSVVPLSTSTATVTYTIDEDTATLKKIFVSGINLSADKCRISYKKNSGSFKVLTLDKASKASEISALGDHTFVLGDVVTFKIEMSVWDRLDGNATLLSTRDKLIPTDVRLNVELDTSGDLVVNQAIPAFKFRMGDNVSLRFKLEG